MSSVRSERWQDTLFPLFLLIILPAWLASAAAIMCFDLCWAAISPVLPASWRFDPDTAFALDSSVDAECPSCRVPMMLGQPAKETDRQLTIQTARCYQCPRGHRRLSLGKFWSAWKAEG